MTLKKMKKARKRLIKYLKTKLAEKDWHGVRDACVDIETLEVRISIRKARKKIGGET